MTEVIHIQKLLNCSPQESFDYFTDSQKATWMTCEEAVIEPFVGGKYELFWDLDDRSKDSTQGCKILVFQENEFLSFEWKGPTDFPVMNHPASLTICTLAFIPKGKQTRVHFLHSGWGQSQEWKAARDYFDRVWNGLFDTWDLVEEETN